MPDWTAISLQSRVAAVLARHSLHGGEGIWPSACLKCGHRTVLTHSLSCIRQRVHERQLIHHQGTDTSHGKVNTEAQVILILQEMADVHSTICSKIVGMRLW